MERQVKDGDAPARAPVEQAATVLAGPSPDRRRTRAERPVSAECLDERTAWALAAGSLPGDARARATDHLDSCDGCRELVANAALAADADAAPGYRLGAELARGGMGRVVVAEDLRLGREVVVKQLLDDSPSLRRRFEREVRITARLQHPGIVPVYHVGALTNGEPFYAMRRIHGRSLDVVIAEAATMARRLALLPRFLAASEAVAYAHARRVVHRDLKPQNILVGDFGEVVVVDWGLAKSLDGNDDDDRELAAPRGAEPTGALTHAGSILGTPAYMAPEQANGDPADARSDVYALGAVLYQILGGVPPHSGANLALTLVDIVEGRIEPLVRRAPDVPADLAAIVTRAMALDPADRYPDAAALVGDVQSFLTGKLVPAHEYSLGELLRRWLRRHRAAVAATVALVLGLGVIASVAFRRVQAERDRARNQQAASEALVGFIHDDLSPRVRAVNKLPILEGVSLEVDRYYQALARSGAGVSAAGLVQWGNAALLLADVAFERGELAASRAHLERARQRLEDAAGGALFADRAQRRLAIVHERLGVIAGVENRLDDAVRAYERSLAIHRALPFPDPDAYGLSLVRLGRMEQVRGETDRAKDHYRQARDWLRRFPDDPNAQKQLLFATASLGTLAAEHGQLADAAVASQEQLALAEARFKAEPAALDRRFDLAEAREDLALAAEARGDLDAALADHRRAVDLLTELVAFDPDNRTWRSTLATALGRLGGVDYDLEHGDAARASFTRALTMWTELHRLSPDNAEWQAALATAHYNIGLGATAADDAMAARAAFAQAVAVVRDLAERRGSSALALCDFLVAQSQIDLALRHYPDALAAVDEALTVARRWYRTDSSPKWLGSEATLLVTRADIAKAMDDRAQAVEALRAARDRYGELAAVASLRPWQKNQLEALLADLADLERPGR